MKPCKHQKKADQSSLKKLTEEQLQTKKKEKDSGRDQACKYSSIVFALSRNLF